MDFLDGCSECFNFAIDCECNEITPDFLVDVKEFFEEFDPINGDVYDELIFKKDWKTVAEIATLDLYESTFFPYQGWVLFKNIEKIRDDKSYLQYFPRVFYLEQHHYLIVDGHHRIAAAMLNKEKEIEVREQRVDVR